MAHNITIAQRDAVAALQLPFDLSDADIARQFTADGIAIARPTGNPMSRARQLSRQAMSEQVSLPLAA